MKVAIEPARAPAARFDERPQLGAVARPQLDDARQARGRRGMPENRPPMGVQQADLSARDAVPRQLADGVEQRRAEPVVEIARRKLAWFERQVVLDVAGKLLKIDLDVL